MSAAVVTPESRVTTQEAFTSHIKTGSERRNLLPADTQDLLKKIDPYAAQKGKDKEALEIIAGVKKAEIYNPTLDRTFTDRFGLGENAYDITKPMSPEADRSRRDAASEIGTVSEFLRYAQAIQEGTNAYDGYPGRVLVDQLLTKYGLAEAFPFLQSLSDVQQKQVVEEALLTDPKFLEKAGGKMQKIFLDTKNLPFGHEDAEILTATKLKEKADAKIPNASLRVALLLEAQGFDKLDSGKVKELADQWMRDSNQYSVEVTMQMIRKDIIINDPALKTVIEYRRVSDRIRNLEAAKRSMTTGTLKNRPTITEYGTIEQVEQELGNQKQRLESIPRDHAAEDRLDDLNALANTDKDSGGNYVSPLAAQLQEISHLKKQIDDSDLAIIKREAKIQSSLRESKDERMRVEAQLIQQMKDVIPSTIVEILKERQKDLEGLDNERIAKETNDRLTSLLSTMKKNWKEQASDGSDLPKNARIGDDIRFIAYNNTDGIRRLIFRDLNFKRTEYIDPLDKTAGTHEVNISEKYRQNAEYSQGDILEKLTPDEKALLDAAVAKYGTDYTNDLFGAYALAVSRDRMILGYQSRNLLVGKDIFTTLEKNSDYYDIAGKRLARFFKDHLIKSLQEADDPSKAVIVLRRLGLTPSSSAVSTSATEGGGTTTPPRDKPYEQRSRLYRLIVPKWMHDKARQERQ